MKQDFSHLTIAINGGVKSLGEEEIEGTRATLKAVLVDRVIIDNQGRDEPRYIQHLTDKAQLRQAFNLKGF